MDAKSMLLGFLMRGPMTGYELKKTFSLSFSFFSGLSFGSIYPALKKMEQEGLITMRLEVQEGSPNRKVYTITEEGKKAFLGALKAPFTHERGKHPFLTRLFFFAHLTPEERIATARQFLDSVEDMQKELETARPEIETRADHYMFLCYEFGIGLLNDLNRNVRGVVRALEQDKAGARHKRLVHAPPSRKAGELS
jgi:DNA-binding PadR family transcriptional regulator